MQCCEFSQRSHAGKGDKVGRNHFPEIWLILISQSWALFSGLIPWRTSLGKSDNLEDKWAKDSLFVFIDL